MSERPCNVILLTFARRGEEAAIRTTRELLQQRFPTARVCAIGTPATETLLREAGFEHVIVYTKGQSARRVIEEAQLCMPEVMAIVYNDPYFAGHLKLEGTAFIVGAKEYLRCYVEGVAVRISRFHLGLAVFGKSLQLAGRLFVGTLITALACLTLCWLHRSGGAHRANRT